MKLSPNINYTLFIIILMVLVVLSSRSMEKEEPESINVKSLVSDFVRINLTSFSPEKPLAHAPTSLQPVELDKGLISAVTRKDVISVQLFLENQANPNALIAIERSDGGIGAPFYPLLMAAAAGSVEIIAKLLEYGAAVDIETSFGMQAIHIAAMAGHEKVIALLIDKGADVDAKADVGNPIHLAAGAGHVDVIETLVCNGADLNVRNIDRFSPMHLAIEEYQGEESVKVAMVKLLIEAGADISIADKKGRTPITIAIAKGFADVLEVLAANNDQLNMLDSEGVSPLHYAMASHLDENTKAKIIVCLLRHGADIHLADKDGQQPIHYAAHRTSKKTIELLVEHGADLSAKTDSGSVPLDIAQANKQYAIINFITQRTASNKQPIRSNKNIKKRHPATPTKSKKAEKESGEKEEPVKSTNNTCKDLKTAIENNNADAVRLFLEKEKIKADGEVYLQSVRTPTLNIDAGRYNYINVAAMHNSIEAAKVLVEHGARLRSTLHQAALFGKLDFIKWLVSTGVDINSIEGFRHTFGELWKVAGISRITKIHAIHAAATNGHLEVVQWFVEQGVSIAVQDEGGNQPIHWAALFGRTAIIEWLIANGADIKAKNKHGKNALDIAKQRERWFHEPAMIEFLKKNQGSCVVS